MSVDIDPIFWNQLEEWVFELNDLIKETERKNPAEEKCFQQGDWSQETDVTG